LSSRTCSPGCSRFLNVTLSRFFRGAAEHVRLESLETGRVSLIVHLVGVGAEKLLYPILEKRLLFEIAQFAGRFPISVRAFLLFAIRWGRWILPTKYDPLISTVRILETAAHFHLDFMHERVGVANLFLDLAPFTKTRS